MQTVLGDYFIGMYLHGSAASGDLDLHRSNIGFIGVTADDLPNEMLADLEAMHARITTSGLKFVVGALAP